MSRIEPSVRSTTRHQTGPMRRSAPSTGTRGAGPTAASSWWWPVGSSWSALGGAGGLVEADAVLVVALLLGGSRRVVVVARRSARPPRGPPPRPPRSPTFDRDPAWDAGGPTATCWVELTPRSAPRISMGGRSSGRAAHGGSPLRPPRRDAEHGAAVDDERVAGDPRRRGRWRGTGRRWRCRRARRAGPSGSPGPCAPRSAPTGRGPCRSSRGPAPSAFTRVDGDSSMASVRVRWMQRRLGGVVDADRRLDRHPADRGDVDDRAARPLASSSASTPAASTPGRRGG